MTSCLHFEFVRFTIVSTFSAKHFTPNNLFITTFMQQLRRLLRNDRFTSYSRHSERAMTSTGIPGILSGIRTGDNISVMSSQEKRFLGGCAITTSQLFDHFKLFP